MTHQNATLRTTRRGFLKGAAATAGAALVVGFDGSGALAQAGSPAFNPFVKIGADGGVTIIIKHFEMGQGTTTGLATLVAEELDADWDAVTIEFAPAHPDYNNIFWGVQGTGGSSAIANSWAQHRQAGAAARAMLVEAAAEAWGVSPDAVTVERGVISSGGRSAGFGEFAAAATGKTPPAEPTLKDPSAFKLIGMDRLPRKDSSAKTNGTAKFAMDVQLPGMVIATILRPLNPGAKLVGFDATDAAEIRGFLDAKALPTGDGVVVYARNTWAAFQARELIFPEWDLSAAETRSTEAIAAAHTAMLDAPEYEARPQTPRAEAEAAVSGAASVVEAEFLAPYLTHSPMEPLNCTIEPTETGVRVYDGCQIPSLTQPFVAGALGVAPEQVEVVTLFAGGSFGRRATFVADYNVEAALAFALYGGQTPVKLVWMREDDFPGQYYRPMAAHRVRIGVSDAGEILGWDHRVATQSIFKGTAFESFIVHDGVDGASVEGIADTPYAIPRMAVGLSDVATPMKVSWWRSVGHSFTAYVMEVAIDMAAETAGRDPVAFRLGLLDAAAAGGDARSGRLAGALRLAAEKAGWDAPAAEGRFRGVAAHASFGSYVAEVAEVSLDGDRVKIEKLVCAVDCGIAVNPDVIRAQIEGGVGYGLGAAMRNQVTFADGEVEQTNFDSYDLLRIADIGEIETHIVRSAEAPTGVGEPGLPPAAPAVANAIYAATGRRLLAMPWSEQIRFA